MVAGTRTEFRALGTTAVVLVTDPNGLAAAVDAVTAELGAIDKACSRFRPDSDLEAVNGRAGEPVPVSPLLVEAVLVALRAAELTDGDVDPTIGHAIRVLGYDRDFSAIPKAGPPLEMSPSCASQGSNGHELGPGPILETFSGVAGEPKVHVARVPGWQQVIVDAQRNTVRVPAGVRLDLGATAKALASDRAAARAAEAAACGVLVSLGGDIAVAGDPPTRGWEVRVADSHAAGPYDEGQTILLDNGGLATSSTTVRRWTRGDEELHHVVDPRTGRPADVVWRTVSVAAGSCVDANIASTAAIVRGGEAPEWLATLGLPARLVLAGGGVVRVGGWPAEEAAA